MKAFKLVLVVLFASILFASCSKVPAGYKGIKVHLLGTDKGIDHEELSVGRYYIGINEELYTYPVFTQNYVWTASEDEGSENDESISFQSVEGLEIKGDFGITYHIDSEKVSILFETFRKGIDEITDIFLRNSVRDALVKHASKMSVDSIYGIGKSTLMLNVENSVREWAQPKGILIDKIYAVGKFTLPDAVKEALDAKIAATQNAIKAENEIRLANADADKLIAAARGESESRLINARAEAEANKIISASITTILVDYEKIKRWDGVLPQVSGGNALIDLRK